MTGHTYFKGSMDDPDMQIARENRWSFIELRKEELEWQRSQADRELRKWCVEQANGCSVEDAQTIYDWVCGKPKADPEDPFDKYGFGRKPKADAA